jgi:hypothetical protein
LVHSKSTIRPTLRTPGGDYQLGLNIYLEEEHLQTVPLKPISVQGRERQFELAEEIEPAEVLFEDAITLLGFQTARKEAYHPGDALTIQLFWQAVDIVEHDYTVFVQLLGPDGKIYGQMDSQPQYGETPTSRWTPDEIIKDPYRFTISEDAPLGEYQLIAGMYEFETGKRLIIKKDNQSFSKLMSILIE